MIKDSGDRTQFDTGAILEAQQSAQEPQEYADDKIMAGAGETRGKPVRALERIADEVPRRQWRSFRSIKRESGSWMNVCLKMSSGGNLKSGRS